MVTGGRWRMTHDRGVAELEQFLAERGEPLLRAAARDRRAPAAAIPAEARSAVSRPPAKAPRAARAREADPSLLAAARPA
jgi:hypothetical protein